MKIQLLIFSLLAFLFLSCASSVVKFNNFEASKDSIKIIAIIPYQVAMDVRYLPKGSDDLDVRKSEEKAGYEAQEYTYDWFAKDFNKYSVAFQEIKETNELLSRAKVKYRKLPFIDKAQLCKYLGVDGILSAKLSLTRPRSAGASITDYIVEGRNMTFGSGAVAIFNIHDKKDDLLWKYFAQESGTSLLNLNAQINIILKGAAYKFPYKKK